MSDSEKFKKELPSKEKFRSPITDRKISDKEYVLNVWNKFEMKTMKDITSGLCPSHYMSRPGLSWDAMLKMTKIEHELITYMYIYFDKGTRDGIFYISNRYSKANNKI